MPQENVHPSISIGHAVAAKQYPGTPFETVSTFSVATVTDDALRSRELGFLPIPTWLRYNPARPPQFTLTLNWIFAITSTICMCSSLFALSAVYLQTAIPDSCRQYILLSTFAKWVYFVFFLVITHPITAA